MLEILAPEGLDMNLDALLEPAENLRQPCKLGRIVNGLEEPYKSALETLIAVPYVDGGESDSALRVRLSKAGLHVSQPVIYRHRTHECSCWILA